MSTSKRVSRGFHRLAILLSAIPLIVGLIASTVVAVESANNRRAALECANASVKDGKVSLGKMLLENMVDMAAVGCSGYLPVSMDDALDPPKLFWLKYFAMALAWGLGLTFVGALVVYGLVRAIGWVIGGFAAS